jgi:hypothetical protein
VTAPMRARVYRPRQVVLRMLLTMGLIAPAAFLFMELRNFIDVRASASVRELQGVEYLRALEPLGTALGETQTAVISGLSASTDAAGKTLEERIAGVASVDERNGGALGVHARWVNLRTQIDALPKRGDPRALYTSYADVTALQVALVERIAQASGLAVDPDADLFALHSAVTTYLPELTVATGRLADLATLNQLAQLSVADTAAMQNLLGEANAAGAHLVAATETAASVTTDNTLVSNVFAPLDTVRGDLGRLTAQGGTLFDGQVTHADAQVFNTLREDLALAASKLSTSIFDQLTIQLTQRRDSAGRNGEYTTIALGLVILLALLPSVRGVLDLLRYRRERRAFRRPDEEPPIDPRPQWTRAAVGTARERAGAAR